MSRPQHAKLLASALLCLIAMACGSVEAPVAQGAGARPVAPSPTTAPGGTPVRAPAAAVEVSAAENSFVAPAPIKFENAVARAGSQLLHDAIVRVGAGERTVVIDPLIDANTGAQTASTVSMGTELEGLIKRDFPHWSLKPLTRQTLESQPLLLIGTLTPVTIERSIDKQPDAFRIWLTLIDLRTNRVVAKQIDRSTVDSVNPEPLKYFRDSPSWHKDKTVLGYINSCQVNTKIGDPADPDYLARLPAAAVINEATIAYDKGITPVANTLYKEAERLAGDGDLRVLNGLYLTSWQLGDHAAARDAFDKLVATGLDAKRLPLKLLFQPGTTAFNTLGDLPAQYDLWLTEIAAQAGKVSACLKVVGNTSRTGSASLNESLSRRRAEAVEKLLERRNRSLASRLSVQGVGSREAMVGLGTDDQRDALDRRVEFKVVDCV